MAELSTMRPIDADHAGAISATHANNLSIGSNARRNNMVATTHELPDRGYALEVDGRMKAEFTTRDGAKAGGEELKRRFPKLLVQNLRRTNENSGRDFSTRNLRALVARAAMPHRAL